MDTTSASRSDVGRDRFVAALVVALAVGAAIGIGAVHDWPALSQASSPSLPAFIVMFAIAELLVVHVPVREDEHTISFSEIPLVVALFYATPTGTIVAQVLGTIGVLLLVHHQRGTKLAFNVVQLAWQALIAILAFRMLLGSASVDSFHAWVAAIIAVCLADIASELLVTLALVLHQGPRAFRETSVTPLMGTAGAAAKAALGVLAVGAMNAHGLVALLPVGLVLAPMWVAFRAYGRVHARVKRSELLYQFTQGIDGSIAPRDVERAIVEQAAEILRAASVEIVSDPPPFPCDAPMLVGDKRTDPQAFSWLAARATPQALLAPIDGRFLIVAERLGVDRSFNSNDLQLFGALANHAAVALEHAMFISEETYRAQHDPMTGLANRQHFAAGLTERQIEEPESLLVVQVNEVQEINDSLGYWQGSRVIADVSTRLQTLVGTTDCIGRIGEDTFGAVVPCAGEASTIVAIEQTIREPFTVDGLQLGITCSIGVARLERGMSGEHLLQRAEAAQRFARIEKATVARHDPARDAATPRRLVLAHQLGRAIRDHELSIAVQPKLDLRNDTVAGVEVLARWCTHDGTHVRPDEFIEVAEHTTLIHELTDEILELALTARSEWEREHVHVPLAVNVSVRNLLNPDFVARVARAMKRHQCPARALTLEITETQAMSDPERVANALHELVALGLSISIDDFGTGFSSLVALRTLPLHEIKIDRTFVTSIATQQNDLTVAKSTTELGHSLGLTVVAEGAEDLATVDILKRLRVDLVQGWAIARPMPTDAFPQWLRSREPATPDPLAAASRK